MNKSVLFVVSIISLTSADQNGSSRIHTVEDIEANWSDNAP